MKKELSPTVIAVILTFVVAGVVFFAYQTYTAPSAPVAKMDKATRSAMEKESPQSAEANQREFAEWKKTHPGAFTRQ